MAIIQSLAIKNFQSIRERVLIEFKPLTLLYGPNSAGKSAILDALTLVGAVVGRTPSYDIDLLMDRWTHRGTHVRPEQNRPGIEIDVVLGDIKLWGDTSWFSEQIPAQLRSLAQEQLPDGRPITLRIIFTDYTSDHEGAADISRIELFHDARRILSCLWGLGQLRFDDILGATSIDTENSNVAAEYDLPSDTRVEFFSGPLRCISRERFSGDADQATIGGAIALANHLLDVFSSAFFLSPKVVDAARSVIPNTDLQLIGTARVSSFGAGFYPGLPWGFAESPIHKQKLPVTLMTQLGLSQLKSHLVAQLQTCRASLDVHHQASDRDPGHVFLAQGLDDAIQTARDQREESDIEFVNRCLSVHLFLDQGYQIVFDICELLPPGTLPSAKGSLIFWDDGRRIDGLPNTEDLKSITFAIQISALLLGYLVDGQGRRTTFEDVGTGLSCVLPVLAALRTPLSFVQQPELHLHPALQSALGDVFVEVAHEGRVSLVETHSEYVLLRILKRMRQTDSGKQPENSPLRIAPDQVNVLYFDPQPDGSTTVKRIRLTNDGDFADRWPRGFFEERGKDLFDE